jgi:DNA-binding transcriptional ArsR family regulator
MTQFVHPATKDITLAGVLSALADPIRLQIVRSLLQESGCLSCTAASPCPTIAKSTLSNHFRVLREAGLVQTSRAWSIRTRCARRISRRGFRDC